MPRNHRHRMNRKGNKKHKQKTTNKSSNISLPNNENPNINEIVDLNNKTLATNSTELNNRTLLLDESKILQEHYDDNHQNVVTSSATIQSLSSSNNDLKKSTNGKHKKSKHQSMKNNQSNENELNIPIIETNNTKLYSQTSHRQHRQNENESHHNKTITQLNQQVKTPNMHLILTTRSIHRGFSANQFIQLSSFDKNYSVSPTNQITKNNDVKTPNDTIKIAISTPYSKKRPLNNSDSSLSGDDIKNGVVKHNSTKSITPSWSIITSQAKRARGIHHQSDTKTLNCCCTPKRLFHDEPSLIPPITLEQKHDDQHQIIGGGDDSHNGRVVPLTTSVITQTIEKSNKITTTVTTNSTTEIYNEELTVSTKITMPINYSNNCQKSRQTSIIVPSNYTTNFQNKCSQKNSWFDSITNIFHNFGTNLKKKWATITLKRQTSNLASPHQQINNTTTHSQHSHHLAIKHADCYAQFQIMQRTIHDLILEHKKFSAITEEQNKKIENLTIEVMQLKLKCATAHNGVGLMFGNSGFPCAPSVTVAPPPPPPPPPLPTFSLLPMNNTCLREKKTGSRQLQRSSTIATDRPAITLDDILSVKLKKTKPIKQLEPEPKSNNVNILSRSQLKQVRLRTKSRVRSRGASPAQHIFDNCKTGTKSLLELLEDSGRNIQVQNLLKPNQNQSLN